MHIRDEEISVASWIPVSIRERDGQRLVEWLFTGQEPYLEPFFEETIVKCRNHRFNSGQYILSSTIEFLSDIAIPEDSLSPTAFIFHVSRCGSTLLSQLLSLDESHVVLSEVPMIEQLLREPNLDERARCDLLRKVISLYGQKRIGHEERLFIKLDAWHLYDYCLIRDCFPETPCIFLYREPAAVISSHRLRRGVHMVPGFIAHPFNPEPEAVIDFNTYTANVLQCYYKTGLSLCQTGANVFAMNYNEGILNGLLRISGLIGLNLGPQLVERMSERAKSHSKYPGEIYQPRAVIEVLSDQPSFLAALDAYQALEAMRLS